MKKIYGKSRIDTCPFCSKQATVQNKVGLLVCKDHREKVLPDIRCVCGDYLDIQQGKYGPFFSCFHCGTFSFAKGMEIMRMEIEKKRRQAKSNEGVKEKEKIEKEEFCIEGKNKGEESRREEYITREKREEKKRKGAYINGEFLPFLDDL